MRLSRRAEPFDSDGYIFELKIDGFRSLAFVEEGKCDLVSRNGNTFRNFKDLARWIGENLRVENAVSDGEISCVDDTAGRCSMTCCFVRPEKRPCAPEDGILTPGIGSSITLFPKFLDRLGRENRVHFSYALTRRWKERS